MGQELQIVLYGYHLLQAVTDQSYGSFIVYLDALF